MSKATLTLEDKDGQIQLSIFLEGGFQADSHAHQHAGLILKYLDSIAGMQTEQAVQWVDGAYVPSAEQDEPQIMLPRGGDDRLHLAKG